MLLILPAGYGYADAFVEAPMDHASMGHDADSSHDCCDDPGSPANPECGQDPQCGKCSHASPVLLLAGWQRATPPTVSAPAGPEPPLLAVHSPPPFKPPIA
jgi:hypothetical protein